MQITLQILRALIDKSPRDLPLYAPFVLRILLAVLSARDLTTVEESVATFETFCEHQDTATLAADQELIGQYEEVVRQYARLAGNAPLPSKAPMSAPVKIRWRSAGLQAIKSITGSEAVTIDSGKQVPMIVTTILENLDRHSEDQLLALSHRANADKDNAIRRRMSIATVQTADSIPTVGASAPATTADADRQAEEEVGLLALQSMRQVFTASNRSQIRWATSSLLRFLMERPREVRPETAVSSTRSGKTGSWSTTVMDMIAQVTPVQDRFIIVVTAMESLIRSPSSEENLEKQLVLATIVESLLGSSINMIGLSVMDVLLGLIHHVLILLQLGGKGSDILPHHQQLDAIDLFQGNNEAIGILPSKDPPSDHVPQSTTPSVARQELLLRLKRCIANLATHIYYSDQVSDMVLALLRRLKPSPVSPFGSPFAAVERPDAAAKAISASINMNEDASTDDFFSFATARTVALDAVKEVLLTANKRGTMVGAGAIGRNKVSIRVWDGTEWLIRDEDRRVRCAYVEALLIWLRVETSRADLRVDDGRGPAKKPKLNGDVEKPAHLVARAGSNSSAARPRAKSNFLQLIHLAAYDDALESPESERDVTLLYTLLVALVDRLGVNAVCRGLPMVLRLQEDALSDVFESARAKLNISSLVHGYLLYVSQRLELDTTLVGHEIGTEISSRRKASAWLKSITLPPLPTEKVAILPEQPEVSTPNASLKPFTNLSSLVDQIAWTYSAAIQSPPSSPLASPSRSNAVPLLASPTVKPPARELPTWVRESMLKPWTKEVCMASVEKESTRTTSPRGSRTGTSNSNPNGLLAVNSHSPRDASPAVEGSRVRARESSGPLPPVQTAQPRTSNPQLSGPPTPTSNSDQPSTLRVEDMKRVLAGGSLSEAFSNRRQPSLRGGSPLRNSSAAYETSRTAARGLRGPSLMSVGSDSIVDAEGFESASEGDPDRPLPSPQKPPAGAEVARQHLDHAGQGHGHDSNALLDPASVRDRPQSSSSAEDPQANAKALKGELDPAVVRGSIVSHEGVPPVPPLPEGLTGTAPSTGAASVDGGTKSARGRGSSERGSRVPRSGERRIMVQALLGSIETSSGASKGLGLPPY